eukprot:7108339-Alexandrium_andersonii.AAC.1
MRRNGISPGSMLHSRLSLTGNDRGDPVGPGPGVARRCLWGSKATRVANGEHFQGDETVVADVV